MYEAGLKEPGGMVAVMGLDEASLAEICRETDTRIANINCPGQLVISGARENVTQAADLAKSRGASRAVPLKVSGAFHTPLMQSAVDGMSEVMASLSFQQPQVPIIANTTAQPMVTTEEIKAELLRQLCNGIQWQRSIEYMINNGVVRFIEIGPGKVLSGLIKRIDGNVEPLNMSDTSSITALVDGEGRS